MMDNIVNMPTPKNVLVERLRAARARTEKGRREWIEGMADEAVALTEARGQFPSNNAFSHWLIENEVEYWGADDRAAMIHLGRLNRDTLLFVLDKVADDKWQPRTIWQMLQQKRMEYIVQQYNELSLSHGAITPPNSNFGRQTGGILNR